jgi:hypothetical protein
MTLKVTKISEAYYTAEASACCHFAEHFRYDASMKKWLWERRFTLLLIGVVVPPLVWPSLWKYVMSDWRFWVPYSGALFVAAILIASRAVDDVSSLFHKG